MLFATNTVKTLFNATFVNNSTTITATAALPSWVQGDPVGWVTGQPHTGTMLYGTGIAGVGDPNDPASTRIVSIDGARTTIVITNPTTTATVQPLSLLLNPVLSGVVANLNFTPLNMLAFDRGAYASLPASTALPVSKVFDGLSGGAVAPVSTSITVTPARASLQLNFGTDNATALANWAAAIRTADTLAVNQGHSGTGIEAIWRPGCYFTTGSLNLVGMQDEGGPFMSCRGVSLHCAHAPPGGAHPKGRIAVDLRASRCYVLDGLQVIGDRYFPPVLGLALGRFDLRLAANASLRNPSAWGSFLFAGMTCQSNETNTITQPTVTNEYVPPTATTPVFGIVIDGWQHWQPNIPCEFGPTGTDADYGPLPWDQPVSFNSLLLSNATSMATGGGFAWSIGGTSGLTILNSYGECTTGPAILWYRVNTNAYVDIHCEAHNGVGNLAGLQDAIMLCSIGRDSVTHLPNSTQFQFAGTYRDLAPNIGNALFAYDIEGHFGNGGNYLYVRDVTVKLGGFSHPNVQVFDQFPPAPAGASAMQNISQFVMGDISLGSTSYTALSHLMNRPAIFSGHIKLGDSQENWDLAGGYIQADSGLIRGPLNVNTDLTAIGNVYAETGLVIGPPEARAGNWTPSHLLLGAFGTTAHPATAVSLLAFAGLGNTGVDTGVLFDHTLKVATPGTLDISGSGTNNAFVHINGSLAVFAPMSLPNGSTATTQAPGDNTTKVATTAFAGAAASAAAGAIVLPAPSITTPVMDGTGAIGVGTTYARADHVHPSDSTKFNVAGGTITGGTTFAQSQTLSMDTYIINTNTIGNNVLHISGGAASGVQNRRRIVFETLGSARADMGLSQTNESGSNAGSNFVIRVFADDGSTILCTPIQVTRTTGLLAVGSSGTGLQLAGNAHGFFGATPIAKPAITGSRSGNAALASALTQLAALGIITDSSTA